MKWVTASGQGTLAIEFINNIKYLNLENHQEAIEKVNASIRAQRYVLDAIDANCNSAISIQSNQHDFEISGEIYGKKKYISFLGSNSLDAIESITKQDGLKLLNEHN